MKECLELFIALFRVGCTTFGGGYAILPVIEREIIRNKGWITMEETMDYYSIGQVTPGVIAINVSTFIGYKRKGVLGSIASTLGFLMPGMILTTLAALFLQNLAEIPLVKHAFGGIRVAVGVLISNTIIRLIQGIYRNFQGLILFFIILGLSTFFNASPVALVISAGAAGFLLDRPWVKKKEAPSSEGIE